MERDNALRLVLENLAGIGKSGERRMSTDQAEAEIKALFKPMGSDVEELAAQLTKQGYKIGCGEIIEPKPPQKEVTKNSLCETCQNNTKGNLCGVEDSNYYIVDLKVTACLLYKPVCTCGLLIPDNKNCKNCRHLNISNTYWEYCSGLTSINCGKWEPKPISKCEPEMKQRKEIADLLTKRKDMLPHNAMWLAAEIQEIFKPFPSKVEIEEVNFGNTVRLYADTDEVWHIIEKMENKINELIQAVRKINETTKR